MTPRGWRAAGTAPPVGSAARIPTAREPTATPTPPHTAETATAGAAGAFVDLNKDGCRRVGAGFTNLPSPPQDNAAPGVPYIVPGNAFDAAGSPVVPGALSMPYGGGKFRTATVGQAFSGASPLWDVGFVAITPTGAPQFLGPPETFTCNPVHTCPECDAGSAFCPTCGGTGDACSLCSQCCSNTCTGSVCH